MTQEIRPSFVKLFKFVKQRIYEESGDGSAIIISDNYIGLADAFEKYESSVEEPYFTRKITQDNYISYSPFSNCYEDISEEGIVFSNMMDMQLNYLYDVVVVFN